MSQRAIARLKNIFNVPSLLGVLVLIGSLIGFQEVFEAFKLKSNNPLVSANMKVYILRWFEITNLSA